MTTIVKAPTPDDVLSLEAEDHLYELVDGALCERPMSTRTSWIAAQFVTELTLHARLQGSGYAGTADGGLQFFPDAPDRVRRADAFFVSAARLPDGPGTGHLRVAPDLVVEVVSPHDGARELEEKVQQYLAAGVRLVWVAYPEARTVHVFRPGGRDTTLDANGELDGEDVLPGFRCAVATLLPV